MKKIILVFLAAAATFLAGCVVTSVCPFYTEKDLTFESALLGNWINEKKADEVWSFQKAGPAYRFTLIEGRNATVMEARAFRLNSQLFLDIASIDQDIHVIPAHYLLKVSQIRPLLCMSELDVVWLTALLDKDPTALRHYFIRSDDKPEARRLVLTADTAELQSFVIAHLKTKEAWQESFTLKPAMPFNGIPADALGGTLTAR